jgi:hypothetical protein
MNTDKTSLENESQPSCLGAVRRSFSVSDWVVYKPFENCSKVDISGKGEIIEDLGDGMYKVTFGHTSMYGTRTGKYCWINLWAV